ncbi:hypothetical protein [Streptosporangium vulgare]|uniref:hypothetical protein n=1 Tax=Streptosporangium vulgare TaxID=46190 RepID=UPI0031D3AD7F
MSMVHMSLGMRNPASRHLLSEPAIIAGMARATLPHSATPWQGYVDDYDRVRDTMAQVLDGFEDFNPPGQAPAGLPDPPAGPRAGLPHRVGRAEFSNVPVPDVVPAAGRLTLARCAPTTSGTPPSTPTTTATGGSRTCAPGPDEP